GWALALAVDGRALRVAARADVELALRRELGWVGDRVVDLLRDVHAPAEAALFDVDRARPVAALAVDPQRHVGEAVLGALDEAGHGVVAGHAGLCDGPAEPGLWAPPEARREVPAPILHVPRHRDLVDVAVLLPHVGVGVVARAD